MNSIAKVVALFIILAFGYKFYIASKTECIPAVSTAINKLPMISNGAANSSEAINYV